MKSLVNINRQNFISADYKTVKNSYDIYFTVGETVRHDDTDAGEATIIRFGIDERMNEIQAFTEKGYVHIDFLIKLNEDKSQLKLEL